MIWNFESILTIVTLVSGCVYLADKCYLAKRRRFAGKATPIWITYAVDFFPILLIVLIFRTFLFEPFRIPTGSLKPTLLDGDFIVVNKFDYGLRLPISHKKILSMGEPRTGDIIVFTWPADPRIDYIKRVIGVPGDTVSYLNKQLILNGKRIPQKLNGTALDTDSSGYSAKVHELEETLPSGKHAIYTQPKDKAYNFTNIKVPKGYYFVMGDNRDNSEDSRYFGFVPEANILGKAVVIWFSWNALANRVRWGRIGKVIH